MGPRFDCHLLGISLQWQGSTPPAMELREEVAEEPEQCSLEELREAVRDHTSFFASGGFSVPQIGVGMGRYMETTRETPPVSSAVGPRPCGEEEGEEGEEQLCRSTSSLRAARGRRRRGI